MDLKISKLEKKGHDHLHLEEDAGQKKTSTSLPTTSSIFFSFSFIISNFIFIFQLFQGFIINLAHFDDIRKYNSSKAPGWDPRKGLM